MTNKLLSVRGKTPAFLKDGFSIEKVDIDFLREFSLKNNTVARILLHQSNEDLLHNMIICMPKSLTIQKFHKHDLKDETYHWIEGKVSVVFVDINGNEISRYLLCEESPIVRVPKQTYHGLIPLSECVIFHESRPGPFEINGDSVEIEQKNEN